MTKEEREQSLVNARRACLMLVEYAFGKHHMLILGDPQREEVASLLEEFGRLDAKEQRQREEGQKGGKYGKKGAKHGKKGGRPPANKARKKKSDHARVGATNTKSE